MRIDSQHFVTVTIGYRPLALLDGSQKVLFKVGKAVIGISRRLGSSLRFLRSFQLPTVRPFSASGFTMSRVSVDVTVVLRAPT